MNKRAEIWMVFPPDQEYRYGEYPFNTTEERNWVNELAMKIGEERNCKTFVKVLQEDGMNLELSMIPKSGVISTNFEEIKEKLEEEMSTYKTMRVDLIS